MAAAPQLETAAKVSRPHDLEFGEEAEPGLSWCPFKLLRGFPHQHVKKESEKVAMWFRANIFTSRKWDLYCISDLNGEKESILMVPTAQFERMIADANKQLNLDLKIPTDSKDGALVNVFDGPILPRFVRRIDNQTGLSNAIELSKLIQPGDIAKGSFSKDEVIAYGEKIELIYDHLSRHNSKADKKEARRRKAIVRQKGWGQQLKRAQRYLGMRHKTIFGFDEQPHIFTANETQSVLFQCLHTPFPMECMVRLISFDVEAAEFSSTTITEIGLAILDTQRILDSDPMKTSFADWGEFIETHHLRITEHKDIVNKTYVKGCPDDFLFGTSEFVGMKDVHGRLSELIRGDENFVLVGHDVGSDVKYFESLGIRLRDLAGYRDEIDTKDILRSAQRCNDARSLEFLCRELSVSPSSHFHNAGNDAVYTMQCLLKMVQRKSAGEKISNSERDGWEPEGDPRDWSDGNEDDGGLPLVLRRLKN
ncbi:hypothetical protein PFICI_07345 [Pestalotiopsis fici W106-1]|uniref:Exonuclease domain-containing protein n=1 Tax=Pestalotiopsis fici (strain W106-1 / CGMCC3.15140) TaxID=1229662 RepID=W3X3T6_PESFW|nr:uncharacterized protein PFICI_07345 [Pestalotiopsis fici W106-1]ETS79816.1 hypothetical protein PFICI_07345 [Pestalotiopsis fici W106-1]